MFYDLIILMSHKVTIQNHVMVLDLLLTFKSGDFDGFNFLKSSVLQFVRYWRLSGVAEKVDESSEQGWYFDERQGFP